MTVRTTLSAGLTAALLGATLVPTLAVAADADPFDGRWHFTLTPYLWLPNVNANLSYDFPRPQTDQIKSEVGPNDYVENLKFGLSLVGEVRKGPWSAFSDIIYLDFGNEETRVRDITGPEGRDLVDLGVRAETELSATLWSLAGAYRVVQRPEGHLDVFVGFRHLGLDTDLEWTFVRDSTLPGFDRIRAGKATKDIDHWDAILGVKGQMRLGETSWYMPYYLDLGTGDSELAWQAMLGVGYRFDWGSVNLSIRSLSYEFDEADADLRFTGPAVGVSFLW
jgi:hypothetical protein